MATLSNFGEIFASKVLGRTYVKSVTEGICNRDYERELNGPGDRVNILSFLNGILFSDYTVGTDMASETIIDTEDQLVAEKRKSYNFTIDRLEEIFTYAGDVRESLLDKAAEDLAKIIDMYVLYKVGEEAKAGNWVGIDMLVKSGTEVGGTAGTAASIVTSATGGTITVQMYSPAGTNENQISYVEDRNGDKVFAGFQTADLYKGVRLRSTAAFVTPWYRISGITSCVSATVTEWDEAVSGSDFEEGYTLRGLFGGDGFYFPKYGTGEAAFPTYNMCGWEVQAARATAISATSIYDQVTLLAEALDDDDVAPENRHLTVPPQLITMLRQSAEMQPSGIAELYTGTVVNGRVMRVGAFDVHMASSGRLSTRVGRSLATNSTTINPPDVVLSDSGTGYIIPANHVGFMTYGDKWAENRVVDAVDQFAKKYQGLFVFGAKVPKYRRKYGAVLFGNF